MTRFDGDVQDTSQTLVVPAGTYQWMVWGVNSAGRWGNPSSVWSFTTQVDSTAPSVPGAISASPNPTNGVTTVTWGDSIDNQSGLAGYTLEYSSNGGASWLSVNTTASVATLDLAQGSYQLRVRARDNVGNISGWSNSASNVLFDKTAPLVTSLTASPNPTRSAPVLYFSYVDNTTASSGINRVEVWRTTDDNGVPQEPGWTQIAALAGGMTTTYTDRGVGAGIYWYGLHVVDNAGNCITETGAHCGGVTSDEADVRFPAGPLRVVYDTTPPAVTSVSPSSGTYNCSAANPLQITAQGQDAGWPQTLPVTLHYTTDAISEGQKIGAVDASRLAQGGARVLGVEAPTCSSAQLPFALAGSGTVNVVACDAVGNISGVEVRSYTCDVNPPAISYSSAPAATGWLNQARTITVQASDTDGVQTMAYCVTTEQDERCNPADGVIVDCAKQEGDLCQAQEILDQSGSWIVCAEASDTIGNRQRLQCGGPFLIDIDAPSRPFIDRQRSRTPTADPTPYVYWQSSGDDHSGVRYYNVIIYNTAGLQCYNGYTTQTSYPIPASCTGATPPSFSLGAPRSRLGILQRIWQAIIPGTLAAGGTPPVSGTYTVFVAAVDWAGNFSLPDSYQILIDRNAPTTPVIKLTGSPSSTPSPTNLTQPTVVWNPSTDTQSGVSGYCVNFYQKNQPTPSGRVQCGRICVSPSQTSVTLPAECYSPGAGGGWISQTESFDGKFGWFKRWLSRLFGYVFAAGNTSTVGGGDGTYSFEVRAYDGVGNYSGIATRDILIDRTPPPLLAIDVANTTPSPTNNLTPRVTWIQPTPPDPSGQVLCGSIQFFDDGPLNGTSSGGIACGAGYCPAPGVNSATAPAGCCLNGRSCRVELTSQDGAGNVNPQVTIQRWEIDTSPPTFSLAPYGYQYGGVNYVNSANQNAINFTGACGDNWNNILSVYIELVGSGAGDLAGGSNVCSNGGNLPPITFDLTNFAQGPITGKATIVDQAGNLRSYPIAMVKDTIAPGVAGGEVVQIAVNTNKGARNYIVKQTRNGTKVEDNQFVTRSELFTNSNFPTLRLKCEDNKCQTGTFGDLTLNIRKDNQLIDGCLRLFEENPPDSSCTGRFNSANLKLRQFIPNTNQPQNNNAIWQIDISFLKDLAGNSPPAGSWLTFDVLNLAPVIIPR